MKTTTKTTLLALSIITIAACSASKKSTASTTNTAATPSSTNTTTTSSTPLVMAPPSANGIYAPGEKELTAIQVQYKDVTLDKLQQGHALYTQGACVGCHSPKNIYKRGEGEWKAIIEDMAQKANISDAEKDAVYKYVLAIKATQPKNTN